MYICWIINLPEDDHNRWPKPVLQGQKKVQWKRFIKNKDTLGDKIIVVHLYGQLPQHVWLGYMSISFPSPNNSTGTVLFTLNLTGDRQTYKLHTVPTLPHNLGRQDVVTVLTSLDVGCWWCVVVCVCPCCVTPDEGWWWWWTNDVPAADTDEDCWWCEDADVGAEAAEPADVMCGGDDVSCNNDGGCCCCCSGAVLDGRHPFSELCATQIKILSIWSYFSWINRKYKYNRQHFWTFI